MTWEEHEKLYCEEVDYLNPKSIYNISCKWSDACKFKDCFELGYEFGNTAKLKCVKYKNKYYVIFDESK